MTKMYKLYSQILPSSQLFTPSIYKLGFLVRRIFITLLVSFLLLPLAYSNINRVVIDPGHGGHDKGGSHLYVYEKHLALDTARRLEKILRAQGISVVMTRTRDRFIELENRAKIGNRHTNSLFISIHYNWTNRTSIEGIETYYYFPKSYPLAKYVHRGVMAQTGARSRFVKRKNFLVIKQTKQNPSILVECGFLSNPKERANAMSGIYRQKLAEGIAKGIMAYRYVYGKRS